MKFKIWLKALVILCLFLPESVVFAQTQPPSYQSVRRNTATVIFFGLGGAVLGLSTLSFYGEPEKHISNIYWGLAAGLAVGGFYVAQGSQDSALASQGMGSTHQTIETPQEAWARRFADSSPWKVAGLRAPARTPTIFNYSWSF